MSKFPEDSQYRTLKSFSERLKAIMEENDCKSNKQFAELVGVSVPVITKAVNFCIVPTLRMIIKIADKTEVSLTYLLGLSDKNDFIPSPSPSDFYTRLEELTKEKKTNYGKVTSNMSFPRMYIYEWNREKTLPSVDYLFDLAKYFDVSPDYLLGRTDYKN